MLGAALVILPPFLVPAGRASFADLAKAESDARGNLVAALGVLAVLIGAVVGFLNFRESQRQNLRSLELSRRGQLSERFSKAIDQLGQLGDDRLDIRIGAIYSLEQIARDSPDDLHGPVMETLTAFLRGHSEPLRQQAKAEAEQAKAEQEQDEPPPTGGASDEAAWVDRLTRTGPRPSADFMAIATVLRRRDWRRDTQPLDLRGAHLPWADLIGANLERALLIGADLDIAYLTRANLKGASLGGANLRLAMLIGAHLEGADLAGAHLHGAFLRGTERFGPDASGLTPEQLAAAHCWNGAELPSYLDEWGAEARS